jgi:hypothetical protein
LILLPVDEPLTSVLKVHPAVMVFEIRKCCQIF